MCFVRGFKDGMYIMESYAETTLILFKVIIECLNEVQLINVIFGKLKKFKILRMHFRNNMPSATEQH